MEPYNTEQKLVTLRYPDRYSFFFVQSSDASFYQLVEDGWILKFIEDDKANMVTVFLFERVKQ